VLFPRGSVIGMVHVAALPGSPRSRLAMEEIVRVAVAEARLLDQAGYHGVLIENMHDVPYLRREVGVETVAAMACVAGEVRRSVGCHVGVQILAGANQASLAVALAAGLDFIRAEGFVFASVADEGLMADADAGALLRFRQAIGAESVRIYVDVKKKHSAHAITADVSLAEAVEAAEFFGADGVIVTGSSTGKPADLQDLRRAREAATRTLLVGSGATPNALTDIFTSADAVIVGSWIKREGHWSNPIDSERARTFIEAARRAVA
jgi:uncharacterized protein